MKTRTILFSSLLIVVGSSMAGESLLGNVAKQTAVESIKSSAPEVAQKVENAKSLTSAPSLAKEQAQQVVKESVNQKIDSAIPAEAKQTAATIKAGNETAINLKNTPNNIKEGAKQKAAEKALDLLR